MVNLNLPSLPRSPMYVDDTMTLEWQEFFRDLYNRVGGHDAPTNTDLGESIISGIYDIISEDNSVTECPEVVVGEAYGASNRDNGRIEALEDRPHTQPIVPTPSLDDLENGSHMQPLAPLRLLENITTTFTDGSVLFAEDDYVVEDNGNLRWDREDKKLQVGGTIAGPNRAKQYFYAGF